MDQYPIFEEYLDEGIKYLNEGGEKQLELAERNIRTYITNFKSEGTKSKEAYNYLGIVTYKLRRDGYEKNAKDLFHKSINIDKNYPDPYFNTAEIYFQKNEIPGAISYYQKCVDCTIDFPQIINAFYNLAILYMEQGDQEKSLNYLMKTIEKDRTFRDALYRRGEIYLEKGEFSVAADDFKSVNSFDKNNYLAYVRRSIALKNINNNKEAIDCLDEAIEIKPDDLTAYFEKAKILNEIDVIECKNYLESMLEKFPNNLETLFFLGKIYSKLDNYDSAKKNFEKVKELNPNYVELYYELGMLYFRFEHYDAAIEEFKISIDKNPEFLDSFHSLSQIYKIRGDYEEALKNMNIVIEKEKIKENFLEISEIYFLMGNDDQCLEKLREAIEMDQDYSEAYNLMGKTYKRMRNFEKTKQNFGVAIEKDPSNIKAIFNMGEFLVENNLFLEGIKYIDDTIRLDPNHAKAYYLRGFTKKNEQKADALNDFNIAIDKGLKEPDLFYQKALILEHFGNDDEAITMYNEAIKLNKDHKDCIIYHFNKAKLEMKKGLYGDAKNSFDEILKLDDKPKMSLDLRGVCKHKLKSYHEAIMDFNKAIEIDEQFHYPYYNRAEVLFELGSLDQALSDYKKSKEIDGNFPEITNVLYNMAMIYSQKNDMKNQKMCLDKLIEKDPRFKDAYFKRGVMFFEDGDHSNAAKDFEASANNCSGIKLESYTYLGKCYNKLGELDKEIETYDNILKIDDKNYDANFNKGLAFIKKGNSTNKAIECFDNAIKINSHIIDPYLHLARIFKNKDNIQSLKNFKNVVSIEKNHEEANYEIGLIELKNQNYQEAIGFFETVLQNNKSYLDTYFNIGLAQKSINDKEFKKKAIDNFQKLLKLSPNYKLANYYIGEIYFKDKDYKQAEEYFRNEIKINEMHVNSHYNLLKSIYELKRYDEAIIDSDRILKMKIDNNIKKKVYFIKGEIYYFKNYSEEALKNFSEVVKIDKDFKLVHEYMGKINYNLSNYKESITNYDELIRLDKNSSDFYYRKGRCFFELNEYGEALKCFEKALEFGKSNKYYLNLKGITHRILKEYKNAMDCYDEALKIDNEFSAVYNNKGVCYECQGDDENAEKHYLSAVDYNPKNIIAHANLGKFYLKKAIKDKAKDYLQEAKKLFDDKNNIKYLSRGNKKYIEQMIRELMKIEKKCQIIKKKHSDAKKTQDQLKHVEDERNLVNEEKLQDLAKDMKSMDEEIKNILTNIDFDKNKEEDIKLVKEMVQTLMKKIEKMDITLEEIKKEQILIRKEIEMIKDSLQNLIENFRKQFDNYLKNYENIFERDFENDPNKKKYLDYYQSFVNTMMDFFSACSVIKTGNFKLDTSNIGISVISFLVSFVPFAGEFLSKATENIYEFLKEKEIKVRCEKMSCFVSQIKLDQLLGELFWKHIFQNEEFKKRIVDIDENKLDGDIDTIWKKVKKILNKGIKGFDDFIDGEKKKNIYQKLGNLDSMNLIEDFLKDYEKNSTTKMVELLFKLLKKRIFGFSESVIPHEKPPGCKCSIF